MRIPQEIINQASHVDLVAFCYSKSIPLKREGKEYVLKSNDSVYISSSEPYKWYRFSTDEGGKAIDFCMKFLGMTFREAVHELTGCPLSDNTKTHETSETSYSLKLCPHQKRVIAYLSQKRCIDYQIIAELITKGKLAQDVHGNCVFFIKDFRGVPVGAELHGTGDRRFKGQSNRQDGFGFTLKLGRQVQTLAFFESAIDLISFYHIYHGRVSNVLLVSMGGLKSSIVTNYSAYYPLSQVVLCVDNDDKGKRFARQYSYRHVMTDCKDWNEKLCQLEKK